jgi:hypothetical protein
MGQNFIPSLSINSQIVPATVPSNPLKTTLLVGQKITNGVYTPPTPGYTNLDYYKPQKLPAFTNGGNALKYLGNLGINYQIGISYNYNFGNTAPSSVTSTGALTIVQWNIPPYGFSALTNFNLSGVVTQGEISAQVKQAQIVLQNGNLVAQLLVYGTPAFTSTSPMTLTTEDAIIYPDPNVSDPIACMVWDYYQTALSAAPSADGTYPSAILSIVADRDSSVSPTATPYALSEPTSVVTNPDGSQTLNYAKTAAFIGLENKKGNIQLENATGDIELESGAGVVNLANFGYLPQGQSGQTQLSQGSVTALYGGYVDLGSVIQITALNPTGTFLNSAPVNVTPDSTANVGMYLNNITIDTGAMQYPITQQSDYTTKYADWFQIIATLNGSNQALLGHYGTLGVQGNITSMPFQAPLLPDIDDWNNIFVTYPYTINFGDIPYENSTTLNVAAGRIAACVAYLITNGDIPFPGITGCVIKHLPVSSTSQDTQYNAEANGTGNLAIEQGWLPLVPASGGGVSLLQSNTSLTTDTSGVPDIEFRYINIKKRLSWLNLQNANSFNALRNLPNNAGVAYLSDTFIDSFRSAIITNLINGQKFGMFQNVNAYENQITVTRDPNNANNLIAGIPEQLVPQLNSGNITNFIYSANS